MIGRVLAGRYKVVAAVGEGGMSRVWRAQDLNTGKMVAVKVLRDEYRDDEVFVRRFEREAQAASRMTHPNIANLLDVGLEEDGTRYLVIEYVSGITLKQFIRETGALAPERAARIIMMVLAATQHAHRNGVVHRDIKPQNILLDKAGAVKVSDFGIARMANTQTMSEDTETVMGSVYYFSPEQAKGATVDEKSDLYSVGVVFYEMLTGQVPFTGDTPVAIAMKHIQEEPVPPSEINPAVSQALDYVVLKAMAKRPRARYASAADMLQDVQLALDNPETILAAKAAEEQRQRRARLQQRRQAKAQKRVLWMRRLLVGVFTLILLALTAVAGYMIMERILVSNRNSVEVPSVMNKHRDVAIAELRAVGLDPVVGTAEYDLVQEGYVADQSIAPGSYVEPGEMITIFVSQSTYEVRIPNVTNIPYAEANAILQEMGLVPNPIPEQNRAEYMMVISQSPASGSLANIGDTVDITYSMGSVSMPRLIGFTQSQAEQTADAAKLIMNVEEVPVDDPADIGKVVSQIPEPFREVARSTTVTVGIGVASTTVYEADVNLDVSKIQAGLTVELRVVQADGTEHIWETFIVEEGMRLKPITLYSETAGEGSYNVYVGGELYLKGKVVYTR